ncbi:MAG: hypothetical protein J6Y94_03920 [Bacteriovoracaceae bacterium]|nr:hypothetical protein [Bacteriovoracaceae bacterium]
MANPVAAALIKEGYVQINLAQPFTYVSGLQGPIYCDNRQIWSVVEDRSLILQKMLTHLTATYSPAQLEKSTIVGMATGGIPLATLVADRLNLPLAYIRGQKKGHGQGKRLEGRVQAGDRVILIEDLINQGSSIISAIEDLQQQNINILGVAAIVHYQMPAALEKFKAYSFPIDGLASFADLMEEAVKQSFIPASEQALLVKWQQHPEQWPIQ